MSEQTAVITNQRGIHLRPSCVIVSEILKSGIRVDVGRGNAGRMKRVSAPTDILALALLPGDQVRVRVAKEEGIDSDEICRRIAELFAKNYDFK